jgi:putative selenate reductase molybdopterin-binding subunit
MTIASCGLRECILRGAKEFGWKEKRRGGRRMDGPIKRGAGMVILMQGSSIPEVDMSAASVKLNDDGSINLYTGATDLGTGADTVLSQIAAEVLHLPVNDVILTAADTDNSPFDTGAYASSTTYLSGEAVRRACEDLLKHMRDEAAAQLAARPEDLELGDKVFFVKGKPRNAVKFETIARRSMYMTNQRQLVGNASAISHVSPPPFAAHFAEVEVDTRTGELKILSYVAAVDCGVAINPKLAEGQCEGAILNAISSTTMEEYIFNNHGRMVNPTFNYYKLHTPLDAPPIKVMLVETHEPTGPYGAKSVSEINTNGPLPVLANAIYDATGVRLRKSPFTPEKLLNALRGK